MLHQKTKLFAAVILVLFISPSCNQWKVIDEEKFVHIYTDILIYKDTASFDEFKNEETLKKVLKSHNVSLEDYKSTIEYYNQDAERWEKFFAKAAAYLEAKQKSASK